MIDTFHYYNKKYNILLFLILLLAIFLRFYNFENRYTLGDETLRDAFVGIEGARQLQFPLTGPFSSLGPFTFGPWYWYQLIIFSLITQSYLAPWIYLSLLSVLYVFVMYKIGELLYGKNFGLLLALFAAISPLQLISAIHLTNPNMIHVFSALSIYLLLRLVKDNLSSWWAFGLGIILGIGLNIHYQMNGFVIVPFILLLMKPKKFLYFLSCGLGVFVTFLPLLFFDMNNRWFMLRNMLDYARYGRERIYVPNSWTLYLRDFWPGFWGEVLGIGKMGGMMAMIAAFLSVCFGTYKKYVTKLMGVILVIFLYNFIILRYYWGERFFGYVNFLAPLVYILTAYVFYVLSKYRYGKYIAGVCIIVGIFFAVPNIQRNLAENAFTLEMKRKVAAINKKYPNDTFVIYKCDSWSREEAYSIMFLLEKEKKLKDGGRKLAIDIHNSNCSLPVTKNLDTMATFSATLVNREFPQIDTINVFDISSASESALTEHKWMRVTSHLLFNNTTRWWLREKLL